MNSPSGQGATRAEQELRTPAPRTRFPFPVFCFPFPALLLALACARRPAPPPPPAEAPSAAAEWVAVRPPQQASFLEVPATVLAPPEASGAVKPPYPGRINRVMVRPGDQVTRGQPIAEIIMPDVVAAAGSALAAATRLEAFTARKKQLDALRAEGLVRQAELTEVEMALAEARAEEQRARAVLRSAGVEPGAVARLVDTGGATVLRSPVAGTVIEVNAALGESRDAGGPPVARIAGTAPARIEARLTHGLPPDSQVEFVPPGGTAIPVRLVALAPARDPRDGTTPAWFEPEQAARLPAGTTGKLRVRPTSASGLVLVPAAAVGAGEKGPFVLERVPGKAPAVVPVEVVVMAGADALVRAPALAPGDEILADAAAAASRPVSTE